MADQLQRVIDEKELSVRELARRLAGEGATPEQRETHRRWLTKVLKPDGKDGVRNPTRKKRRQLAAALELPQDYFTVVGRQAAPARPTVGGLHDRLEELSETVEVQQETTDALISRVEALERAAEEQERGRGES